MNLFTSLLSFVALGADPKPEQLDKIRGELKSSNVEIRRTAMKELIHSDLSSFLFPEMQAGLKDADGEVRSIAATSIGNLGAKADTAIPVLIIQLEKDGNKEARE